ncbi:MAG TPA: hypothetical protein VG937_28220 [Polyangiaceae bacterium]|nr:hypothetical protein [Polyangiaceae bacterium]
MPRVLLLMVCALLSAGCSLLGGLRVETLGSGAQRPANVAAFVSVSDGDEPVTDLEESNFTVYENEQAVPADQTRAKLLDRELAGAFRTVLLVDLGFAAAPDTRRELTSAINVFLDKVRATQAVTVFGFDGSAGLKLLGEFAKGDGSTSELRLPNASTDLSRNLNGAVQRALVELESRLAQSRKPIRVGTLVVFANGPDIAGRVSERDLDQTLDEHHAFLVSIGIGEQAPASLQAIGRDGFFRAQSASTVAMAFEETAYRVANHYEKHYLFSYCSPSRAGERRLRLEVRFTDKKGNEKKGDAEAEFDAKGYAAGCDPANLPPLHPALTAEQVAKKATPRASGSSDKQSENPSPSATPATQSETDHESEEGGAVVPPPKRPGYAE